MTPESNQAEPTAVTPNYRLPQVEQLLQHPALLGFIEKISRPVVKDIIRQQLTTIRQQPEFKQQGVDGVDVIALITQECRKAQQRRQQRVINATGIAVHTNLGRSPIDNEIWQQVTEVNTGFSNLELKLSDGKRGDRNGLLPSLINSWLGAEDSVIVNNNAASVYLVLHALAKGKEVIVSRGEQVQIGGGFRIPDILALSGCKLVEVGTTNITTADDYLNAITEDTAMVLMVHQSNFHIQGFTESADIREVAKGLPEHVALVVDQGSGLSDEPLSAYEQPLQGYLNKGTDLVCFSGDKILGGPQAGIIAGKAELCNKLAKNPMMRTFRSGRISLSVLEELLVRKLNRDVSGTGIAAKVVQAALQTQAQAEELAERWQPYAEVVPMQLQVGGGSLPAESYPCNGLAFSFPNKAQQHLDALREMPTPIIAYIRDEKIMVNLATVLEADLPVLISSLDGYIAGIKLIEKSAE